MNCPKCPEGTRFIGPTTECCYDCAIVKCVTCDGWRDMRWICNTMPSSVKNAVIGSSRFVTKPIVNRAKTDLQRLNGPLAQSGSATGF